MPESSSVVTSPTNVCTECGHDVTDVRLLKPDSLFHWRIVIPAMATIVAIVVMIYFIVRSSQTFTMGMGGLNAGFSDPSFSFEQIHRMALGENGNDTKLVDAVKKKIQNWNKTATFPGDSIVNVGFSSPAGECDQITAFGWPSSWYSRWEIRNYDDVLTRSNFKPVLQNRLAGPVSNLPPASKSEWRWQQDSLVYKPLASETGGVETSISWHVISILGSIGLIALAWVMFSAAIWIYQVVMHRKNPRNHRKLKWIITLTTIALMAILQWQSFHSSETISPRYIPHTQKRTSSGVAYFDLPNVWPLPLSGSEILQQPAAAFDDYNMATLILNAMPHSNAQPSEFDPLIIQVIPEVLMQNGHITSYAAVFDLFSIHQFEYVRRPDAGASGLVASSKGLKFSLSNGVLFVRASSGIATEPTTMISVNLSMLGLVLLVITSIWMISKGACRAIALYVVHRRRKQNKCIACGYLRAIGAA